MEHLPGIFETASNNTWLKESKKQKSALQAKLRKAKRERNQEAVREITGQLEMVYDLRKNVFVDRDKVNGQKEMFLDEVHRLNDQTRSLKELIRDRCGYRGREWYDRLEARKKARRLEA